MSGVDKYMMNSLYLYTDCIKYLKIEDTLKASILTECYDISYTHRSLINDRKILQDLQTMQYNDIGSKDYKEFLLNYLKNNLKTLKHKVPGLVSQLDS